MRARWQNIRFLCGSGKNKLLTTPIPPCYTADHLVARGSRARRATLCIRLLVERTLSGACPLRRLLHRCSAVLLDAIATLRMPARPANRSLDDVIALVDAGEFKAADASASTARSRERPRSATSARALEFERERMRRILLDFSLTRGTTRRRGLRKQIPDLNDAKSSLPGTRPACSSIASSTAARATSIARPRICSA